MNLLLHIGVSKTGTTALQKWLAQNHAACSKRIFYPDENVLPGTFQGNHRLLPLLSGAELVWETDFALPLLEQVSGARDTKNQAAITGIVQSHLKHCANKADAAGCDTLLLSNEHLSDRLSTEDIYAFSERFSSFFVQKTLVVYLRRQDAALLSLYAESLKHGSTHQFSDFVERNRVARLTFDYQRIIKDWSACGWDIVPRLYYEKAKSPSWSIIGDFTRLLDYSSVDGTSSARYSINRSPSVSDFEMLRRLNYLQGRVPASVLTLLKRHLIRLSVLRARVKTDDEHLLERCLRRYADGNRWIANTYFDRDELFERTD